MRVRIGKAESTTRVSVRLPERLQQDIAALAKAANRSFNYEILVRLKASLDLDRMLDTKTNAEALEILEKLRARLRDLRLAGEGC